MAEHQSEPWSIDEDGDLRDAAGRIVMMPGDWYFEEYGTPDDDADLQTARANAAYIAELTQMEQDEYGGTSQVMLDVIHQDLEQKFRRSREKKNL